MVPFRLETLENEIRLAIDKGYKFMTCREWAELPPEHRDSRIVVFRIDVDDSIDKLWQLLDVCYLQKIRGSLFLRLHGQYNPFSFESYRIIQESIRNGFEIGYHSEVIDQSELWGEDSESCLKRDIELLSLMFNYKVVGVASHGGRTGFNNLDFWQGRTAKDLGLLYEAYDDSPEFGLFSRSLYISDSEWTQWKCYQNGKRVSGDTRSFGDHLSDEPQLIYLLIHPETFFRVHPYE